MGSEPVPSRRDRDASATRPVRIGAGAGYSGDRIEPAIDLVERGRLDYLVFECLAERTIANAQQQRSTVPDGGYDPFLDARIRAVLNPCRRNGTRIISNMGAANPLAAARRVREIAVDLGHPDIVIAAVTGDDVLAACRTQDVALDNGLTVGVLGDRIISANAYLGAGPIAEALAAGADVVITGRVGDPSLFLGPLIHEFGWSLKDWSSLGKGTLVGHLLECAGQICGGYFADPGYKDVPGMAQLGFPFADVAFDGTAEIGKLDGTGGRIDAATVKEQILYEIHDPALYFQPDVVADFSRVSVAETGPDRVRVSGACGSPRSGTLKVSVSYHDGYVGEGQISYAGPGAVARGRLALEIVRERLANASALKDARYELIGVDSLHGTKFGQDRDPYEVRARVVARAAARVDAERIGNEVEALYTNGPAGGGGAFKSVRQAVALASALIDESLATPTVTLLQGEFA
ncbi:acyclic terpene utilization AtuA family protein [Mesorhizobium sp. SB112]|uniref:acyclic terpene utilization AtuA family protein n=1 Tax=Mesorhizobium sp. SB112 TaxID=3151853 RepID=UPI0032636B7E